MNEVLRLTVRSQYPHLVAECPARQEVTEDLMSVCLCSNVVEVQGPLGPVCDAEVLHLLERLQSWILDGIELAKLTEGD